MNTVKCLGMQTMQIFYYEMFEYSMYLLFAAICISRLKLQKTILQTSEWESRLDSYNFNQHL